MARSTRPVSPFGQPAIVTPAQRMERAVLDMSAALAGIQEAVTLLAQTVGSLLAETERAREHSQLERLMTNAEVAEYLQITDGFVRQLVHRGKLKPIYIGEQSPRHRERDVIAFWRDAMIPTDAIPQTPAETGERYEYRCTPTKSYYEVESWLNARSAQGYRLVSANTVGDCTNLIVERRILVPMPIEPNVVEYPKLAERVLS